MKKRGEITVFLVLILSAIMSMIFVLTASVKRFVLRTETAAAMDNAVMSCFAEYNRVFFDRFHIPVIDSSFKSTENGKTRIEEHFFTYLENSMSEGELCRVSVSGEMDAEEADYSYLYDMAVRYAKEETGIDKRLNAEGDDALFMSYLLSVCKNAENHTDNTVRSGEIEYLLYGGSDDTENINRACDDRPKEDDGAYEDYMCRCLEEENIMTLRKRFAQLVTEYMKENGSPGFDLKNCYHSLSFTAEIRGEGEDEFSITRKYAY